MAAELVNSATSEKLTDMDWGKNIKICEVVAHDPRQAKDVIRQIKKRLGSKNSNTQLYAVMLLAMLMNNIGENIHGQVIDAGLLPVLVKIVKKKLNLPIRERIFLLLDATQTSLGGASGKFPQYYTAYHDLVNAGIQFSQGSNGIMSSHSTTKANNDNSTSASIKSNNSAAEDLASSKHERVSLEATSEIVPESSIIEKAGHAVEVLREVLDAAATQNPEGAKDEFTLDLVEQCSFQKQRVMQLVLTSKDETVVSRAIALNEELDKVFAIHDALLSGRPMLNMNNYNHEEMEEEEEAEQLFRRMRKGKACATHEGEAHSMKQPIGSLESSIPRDGVHQLLIRPLCLEPLPTHESKTNLLAVAIPPPPAKHVERERFFEENKVDGSSMAAGRMQGLSLHSRSTSSSRSLDLTN